MNKIKLLNTKLLMVLSLAFCVKLLLAPACFGITLLTEEEALKTALPDAEKIDPETKTMSEANFAAITEKLGGNFVLHNEGAKAEELLEQRDFVFHFGMKGGEKTGVAIILEEPGKWGPIQFIVGMDMQGAITKVAVMEYKEVRGRPISSDSFLGQFTGKSGKDALEVGKDITGVSGATVSSTAASFVIKKAVVLYEQLYLNQ